MKLVNVPQKMRDKEERNKEEKGIFSWYAALGCRNVFVLRAGGRVKKANEMRSAVVSHNRIVSNSAVDRVNVSNESSRGAN